jgi:hypothetical protein
MSKKLSATVHIVGTEEGDWEALYVDGVLEAEGHSIDKRQLMEILAIPYTTSEVTTDWAENNGFPVNQKDLPSETES